MSDVVEVIVGVIFCLLVLIAFFGLLMLGSFVLLALGMAIVVAVLWAIYLFITATPLVKAAVVVGAVATAVLLVQRRRRKRGQKKEAKKPLFDIRLVNEECAPLEDGIKTLPPNVASAIEEAIGMPSRVYKLCVQTYEGEDVPGGRAEVMALKMLFAPEMIVVRLLRVLDELGLHPSAESRELGWVVYFQKPKPLENSGQAGVL